MSVFIVAECGVNHRGSSTEAMALIDAAKAAGANAAKFQAFNSKRLWGDSRIAHLELPERDLSMLSLYCADVGIEFVCTPFGVPEVEFLTPLVKRWKVASGCITRQPLLDAIAVTGKPAIFSTGMSECADIDFAISRLYESNAITMLHCTSSYPCKPEDVNLTAMTRMYYHYWYPYGYSDHTEGITVALAAAALGASVIEKHITLDRNAIGPDHKASIEPAQFAEMVRGIREIEVALGDGQKRVMPSEEALRKVWRPS